MAEHDGQVGELLKKLDDLKIADNTIVIYTTDNGVEVMGWPDGGSVFLLVPTQACVDRYIRSLVEFGPRQKPG